MAHKLTDYYCIEACHHYSEPGNIKILRQFQITLDSATCPSDKFSYNRNHDLVSVRLWGTNAEQLKKMAKFLLTS